MMSLRRKMTDAEVAGPWLGSEWLYECRRASELQLWNHLISIVRDAIMELIGLPSATFKVTVVSDTEGSGSTSSSNT
jgi:hypothetical protein